MISHRTTLSFLGYVALPKAFLFIQTDGLIEAMSSLCCCVFGYMLASLSCFSLSPCRTCISRDRDQRHSRGSACVFSPDSPSMPRLHLHPKIPMFVLPVWPQHGSMGKLDRRNAQAFAQGTKTLFSVQIDLCWCKPNKQTPASQRERESGREREREREKD